MSRLALSVLLACLGGTAAAADSAPASKPVTPDKLLGGTSDTAQWLMYGGDYNNWRFSPLKDIDRSNAGNMQAVWMFQTGIPGQLEA